MKSEAVFLNGKTANLKSKGLKLELDDVIDLSLGRLASLSRILPNEQIAVDYLVDEPSFVVANKPAGMPVMPLVPGETTTVLNAVVARYPQIQGVGEGGLKSGIVHRLDTDTSGALVIAKTTEQWQHLRAAFSQGEPKKTYLALVHGHPRKEGAHQMQLVTAQHRPARVRVVTPKHPLYKKSRTCSLSFKRLETLAKASLVEIELHTGFLHQIRVMFAELGHPVIGDRVYGKNIEDLSAPRHMLHAHRLKFTDLSQKQFDVLSPLPDDFKARLEAL